MEASNDPTPRPEVRERVLADARATRSATRPVVSRRDGVLLGAAAAASAVAFLLLGGVRLAGRPLALIATTAGGLALVAAVVLAVVARRSMVGPSRGRLIALSVAAPALLLAWKVLVSHAFDGATEPWSDRPGARCFGLTLLLSALPFAAALAVRRHIDATHPSSHGAALGVAVGTAAAVLVDLWCPVGYLPHVLGGHVMPIVLLGALGAILGGRVLGVRAGFRR
ncbi:MAG TPA: NrsF family protein [Polyangia bacterium]|nr:NrsF family protein [Polyangia bacterium]